MTGKNDRCSCRNILLALVLIGSCGWAITPFAQTYPARPVKFVLPGPPGGGPDRVIRLVGEKLNKLWGVPVIVDNRPGGTGMIGAEAVARSASDGYTVLFTFTALVQAPALFSKVPYNLDRDFIPVSLVANAPVFLSVKADSPYRTLPDLLSAARNAAAPLSYGTFGTGSSYHIYGETLARAAKVHLLHVPYKGEALALADLLGGQIQSSFVSVGTGSPQVRAGKIRALALVAATRSPVLPDVPTFPELGFPALDAVGWFGALVPSGTSKEIVSKLSTDINRTIQQPELANVLREMGFEPVGTTPEQFAKLLHSDSIKWGRMIREAGIKANE